MRNSKKRPTAEEIMTSNGRVEEIGETGRQGSTVLWKFRKFQDRILP